MAVVMNAERAKIIRLNVADALKNGASSITVFGFTLTVEYAEAVLAHYHKGSK